MTHYFYANSPSLLVGRWSRESCCWEDWARCCPSPLASFVLIGGGCGTQTSRRNVRTFVVATSSCVGLFDGCGSSSVGTYYLGGRTELNCKLRYRSITTVYRFRNNDESSFLWWISDAMKLWESSNPEGEKSQTWVSGNQDQRMIHDSLCYPRTMFVICVTVKDLLEFFSSWGSPSRALLLWDFSADSGFRPDGSTHE